MQALACGTPVPAGEFNQPARGLLRTLRTPLRTQHRQQRVQRLLHVGPERDLGGIVFPEIPIALAHLHDGHPLRQRTHGALHGHTQRVAAQADQQIVGLQRIPHLSLIARQRTEERRVLRRKLGRIWTGLLIDRRAQQFRQTRGFIPCAVGGEFVAGNEHGIARCEQSRRKTFECRVGWPRHGIDARGLAEIEFSGVVQDVPRQADEYRSRRRRGGDLGRAPHDARQILDPRHLYRPFHQRLRNRHEWIVEQRLHETMPLLLLAGRDDQRRPNPLGVVERTHRVAQARRHMHVARRKLVGCPRITVGHCHDGGLLQAQHIAQLRMLGQRIHDGQLRGTGVAEQVLDALVTKQRKESGTAGDTGHIHPFFFLSLTRLLSADHYYTVTTRCPSLLPSLRADGCPD